MNIEVNGLGLNIILALCNSDIDLENLGANVARDLDLASFAVLILFNRTGLDLVSDLNDDLLARDLSVTELILSVNCIRISRTGAGLLRLCLCILKSIIRRLVTITISFFGERNYSGRAGLAGRGVADGFLGLVEDGAGRALDNVIREVKLDESAGDGTTECIRTGILT